MPNILACTDGSIYASSVYNHTAWAAAKLSASVRVLHMLNPHHEDPVKTDRSGSIGLGAKSALLSEIVELEAARAKEARKQSDIILRDAAAQLTAAGVEEVTVDHKHGRLGDSIDHFQVGADIVVIGKRGNHADFEVGKIGQNLERVVRVCKQPVLVTSREFTKMESFVLAFDGGSSAKNAVEYVASSPLLKGMKCHLLSIDKGSKKLAAALDEAKQTLTNAGFDVSAEIKTGEPEKVIGEAVAQEHIDLLVMGAYGHSHIRHLIVGSTTTAMIRTVKIPVLLF